MVKEENLWVVEMQFFDRWYPTVGVGLTKQAAQIERNDWINKNSGILPKQFRVTKYVRAE